MDSKVQPDEIHLRIKYTNQGTLILSVDDEPGILFTREKLLETAGYKVLSAADGSAALQLFAANAVDLVLLDYAMPGMDGGAVAQEIKRRRGTVPIIMVSASPIPEQILICADCVIRKGQGPALLLKKIDQLLSPTSKTREAPTINSVQLPKENR